MRGGTPWKQQFRQKKDLFRFVAITCGIGLSAMLKSQAGTRYCAFMAGQERLTMA
jgi:hypothetical protein